MTRVTIAVLDPMPAMRQAMKDRINAGFSTSAAATLHADQAHTQKRHGPRCRISA